MRYHYHNHLTIGFTGKMSLAEVQGIIEQPLHELFDTMDRTFGDASIRLISGLADGSDQIASEHFLAACSLNLEQGTRKLGAVLPFSEPVYSRSLTNVSRFNTLYNSRYCDQRLSLDGMFDKKDSNAMNQAYAQQGQTMCYMADVVLAVLSRGYDQGDTGGSMETLLYAFELKKPVILFDLDTQRFFWFDDISQWLTKDPEPMLVKDIAAKLRSELFSPEPVEEEAPVYGFVYKVRVFFWNFFAYLFRPSILQKETAPEPEDINSLYISLKSERDELDKRAQYFQLHYRGGYILNYALALTAIFLAVVSGILWMNRTPVNEEHIHEWLMVVAAFKLFVLFALVFNTSSLNKRQFNKKAIDMRYAAERMRINTCLSALGVLRSPHPALGNHSQKRLENYSGETIYQKYMFSIREAAYEIEVNESSITVALAYMRYEWLEKQLDYHDGETRRMKSMDKKLERFPQWFSFAVIGIVALDIAAGIALKYILEPYFELQGKEFKEWFNSALPYLISFTAFIPAVVTTLNSINFQSEAHRLHTRSKLMLLGLKDVDDRLTELERKVGANKRGSNFYPVLKVAAGAANLFTDEVAEWSLIYEKRIYDQG